MLPFKLNRGGAPKSGGSQKCFQSASKLNRGGVLSNRGGLSDVLPKRAPRSAPKDCSQIVGVVLSNRGGLSTCFQTCSQTCSQNRGGPKRAPRRAPRIVGVPNVLPDVLPESWGSPSVHLSFAALQFVTLGTCYTIPICSVERKIQ
mgnify:CR=1 FL=1